MAYSAKRPWHAAPKVEEDCYTILGTHRDASPEQIAEAYRQLALECHPDVKPDDPRAKKQFMKVQAAFEVLSDPAKRAAYNRTTISFTTTRKPAGSASEQPTFHYISPRPWRADPLALDLVRWPAVCLLVTGFISPLILFILRTGAPGPGTDSRAIWPSFVIVVVRGIIIVAGAVSMLTLKSEGLAYLGAIVALLPCSDCCWSIPIAIWVLTTLSDHYVKTSFRS
jgi:hypothetical protein